MFTTLVYFGPKLFRPYNRKIEAFLKMSARWFGICFFVETETKKDEMKPYEDRSGSTEMKSKIQSGDSQAMTAVTVSILCL